MSSVLLSPEVAVAASESEGRCCGSSRLWLVLLVAAVFILGFWLWSRRQSNNTAD